MFPGLLRMDVLLSVVNGQRYLPLTAGRVPGAASTEPTTGRPMAALGALGHPFPGRLSDGLGALGIAGYGLVVALSVLLICAPLAGVWWRLRLAELPLVLGHRPVPVLADPLAELVAVGSGPRSPVRWL